MVPNFRLRISCCSNAVAPRGGIPPWLMPPHSTGCWPKQALCQARLARRQPTRWAPRRAQRAHGADRRHLAQRREDQRQPPQRHHREVELAPRIAQRPSSPLPGAHTTALWPPKVSHADDMRPVPSSVGLAFSRPTCVPPAALLSDSRCVGLPTPSRDEPSTLWKKNPTKFQSCHFSGCAC